MNERQRYFYEEREKLYGKMFNDALPAEEQLAARERFQELAREEMDEECEHGKTAWAFCGACDGPFDTDLEEGS